VGESAHLREKANNELRQHIVALLREKGIQALAPLLSPLWGPKVSDRYGFASTWSSGMPLMLPGWEPLASATAS